MSSVEKYLKNCRELTRFCSRNGWIDQQSLRFTVIVESSEELIVDVEFDELLMESSGCQSERIPCFGQVHLYLDRFGRVIRAEAI
jgi:hypothetical protein